MLKTKIEIWNISTGTPENTFASFDATPQHAEGILWTSVGIVGYIGGANIALYNPSTGEIISTISIGFIRFFWDEVQQRFLYLPMTSTDLTLEVLPLLNIPKATNVVN